MHTVRTELMTRKGLFLLGAEAAESQLFTKQKAVTGAAASWCLTFSPAMGPVPKAAVSAQAGKGEPSQARPGQHRAPGEEVSNVANDFKNFTFRLARSLPEAGLHFWGVCMFTRAFFAFPTRARRYSPRHLFAGGLSFGNAVT